MPHLKLDQFLVDEARALARHIVEPVIDYIKQPRCAGNGRGYWTG